MPSFSASACCVSPARFRDSRIRIAARVHTHPEQLDRSVFLRGDLTEDQKLEILRKNYADVLRKIEAFLDERTQIVPKI